MSTTIPRDPLSPVVVRPEEAAAMLRVGRSQVYRLLAAGELRSLRIGKSRRIPIAEIERYVDRHIGAEAGDAT